MYSRSPSTDTRKFDIDSLVAALPTESRANVRDNWSGLASQTTAGLLSKSQLQELGTCVRRQQHWYQFLSGALNLEDLTLNTLDIPAVNGIFYMYTMALTMGETIQGTMVKEATMRQYLRAAAMFTKSVGTRQQCPLTDPTTGKWFEPIKKCLRDLKKMGKYARPTQPSDKTDDPRPHRVLQRLSPRF